MTSTPNTPSPEHRCTSATCTEIRRRHDGRIIRCVCGKVWKQVVGGRMVVPSVDEYEREIVTA